MDPHSKKKYRGLVGPTEEIWQKITKKIAESVKTPAELLGYVLAQAQNAVGWNCRETKKHNVKYTVTIECRKLRYQVL